MSSKNKRLFLDGLKLSFPIILGYIPLAVAFAAGASAAGMQPLEIIAMSVFAFTGAGQIAATSMLVQHASLFAIWLTVFILGLRHILLSSVVFERLEKIPLLGRCLLAFGITDEVFAAYTADPKAERSGWFLAGIALAAWGSWVMGTVLGTFVTSLLPASLSAAMGIALYAMFISLLVPGLQRHVRLLIPVLATALFSWILSQFMASSYAIILSSLFGAVVGLFTVREEDLE